MADRIAVMHDGRIEQIGSPLELYDRPANLFVAQFIGSPAMNIVSGTLRRSNGAAHVETAEGIRWPIGAGRGIEGQPVAYGIRPDHLELGAAVNASSSVTGEVIVVEPTGAETELVARVGAVQVVVQARGRPNIVPGDRVGFSVDPANVHLFDKASGERLAA